MKPVLDQIRSNPENKLFFSPNTMRFFGRQTFKVVYTEGRRLLQVKMHSRPGKPVVYYEVDDNMEIGGVAHL